MGLPETAGPAYRTPGPMALAIGGIEKTEDWGKLALLCLTYSDAPGDQVASGPIGIRGSRVEDQYDQGGEKII